MASTKMPSQMGYCPPVYPVCSYSQMACPPHGTYMGPQVCPTQFPNQYYQCQPGFMSWGNQQGIQPLQQPVANQCVGDMAQKTGLVSSFNPQSGLCMNPTATAFDPTATAFNPTATAFNPSATAFNPTATAFNPTATAFNPSTTAFNSAGSSSAQGSSGPAQSEVVSSWARKPFNRGGSTERFGGNEISSSERFRSSKNNSFSSTNEQKGSPPRSFGRFGDQKNEDGWSNRNQNSYGRGSGGGRGNFGSSSWQSNSRGQDSEWRSRNSDFGSQKRFNNSPERFQDRDNYSKRGRWPSSRGRGESGRDSWQPRNRFGSPGHADKDNKFDQETKMDIESATTSAGDEDWETDYPGNATTSEKPNLQSPAPSSPKSNHKSAGELPPDPNAGGKFKKGPMEDHEKEEGEIESNCEEADAATDVSNAPREEQSPSSSPVIVSEEQELGNRADVEEVQTCVLSIEEEDDKGVLVKVDEESQ